MENINIIKKKLKTKFINLYDKDNLDKIKKLYFSAFPENELLNFEDLIHSRVFKGNKIIAFYDDKTFVGFAVIITKFHICNILYIAIEKELRGKGYGTQALKNIIKYCQKNRIVVDVEDPDKNEFKKEERLKRINFYLKAGFKLTNIKYNWNGEDYIILVINGDITEDEFWNFWKNR